MRVSHATQRRLKTEQQKECHRDIHDNYIVGNGRVAVCDDQREQQRLDIVNFVVRPPVKKPKI